MEQSNASTTTQPKDTQEPRSWLRFLIQLFLGVAIITAAWFFYKHQEATRPEARRKRPPRQARLVQVEPARPGPMVVTLTKPMGPVIPARQVTLMPEVSGRVASLDPVVIPGGLVQQGQALLSIDSRDYQAVLEQRRGEQAQAYLNLTLEMGNQKIAQQEYALLAQDIADDEQALVLRKHHLASAQATLRAADAAIARARLDVDRCQISAPFNAVIQEKHAERGAQVSPSSPLLTLIGTDQYWVDAKVRVDYLRWLTIPTTNGQSGARVKVYDRHAWGEDVWREGRVIRLLPDLVRQGQLARLLVVVDDPLALRPENRGLPRMMVGSQVRLEIIGEELTGGFPIRRELLRENDSLWIRTTEGKLDIRPVEIIYTGKDQVYIVAGLEADEKIVVTDMATPVAGMPLRLEGDGPGAAKRGVKPVARGAGP